MNTNHDPFENDLRALQRRALPSGWRDEMLQAADSAAAAAASAVSAQKQRQAGTPRWLLAGWGLAWAAMLVMYFTTPAAPLVPQTAGRSDAAPPLLWQQRAAAIEALLAAN